MFLFIFSVSSRSRMWIKPQKLDLKCVKFKLRLSFHIFHFPNINKNGNLKQKEALVEISSTQTCGHNNLMKTHFCRMGKKKHSSCVFVSLNEKRITASSPCPPTAAPSTGSRAPTSGRRRAALEPNDGTAGEGGGGQEASGAPGSAGPAAGGQRARGAGGDPEKEGAPGADGEGEGAARRPFGHGGSSLWLPGPYWSSA